MKLVTSSAGGRRDACKKALKAGIGGLVLAATLVLDAIFWFTGNSLWAEVAFWVMGAGLVISYISAPFRFPRWGNLISLTAQDVVRIYWDLAALTSFTLGWILRLESPENPNGWLILLSCVGLSFVAFSIWERKLNPVTS